MENHSVQSYDGTDGLLLLDDYRFEGGGGENVSSHFSVGSNGSWDSAGGRTSSTGKRPAGDKGKTGTCKVCGDEATGMYFGALVCVPCKTFFLRYAGDGFAFVCKGNKDCEISVTSRTQCKFCRYQKCLKAGMFRRVRPSQVQLGEGQQLCVVCHDLANGIHFGAITCEGCKKFFRRGLVEHEVYQCKNGQQCLINPRTRNSCRFCRYKTCLEAGMSRDAIQMGRPSKLAMESFGVQRSLRGQSNSSSVLESTMHNTHNALSKIIHCQVDLSTQYLANNSHHDKDDPTAWNWSPTDHSSIVATHPYPMNSASLQMNGVCDFLESPDKRIRLETYCSPTSDIYSLSGGSTTERHTSSSCHSSSLLTTSSPEVIQYNQNGWEISNKSPQKQTDMFIDFYHEGQNHCLPAASSRQSCAESNQKVAPMSMLPKFIHEKNVIPLSLDNETVDLLQICLNTGGSKSQPLILDHILQDKEVSDAFQSLLEQSKVQGHNNDMPSNEFVQPTKYNFNFVGGGSTEQQMFDNQKSFSDQQNLMDFQINSGNLIQNHNQPQSVLTDTKPAHMSSTVTNLPHLITSKSLNPLKQNQNCIFTSALSSSSTTIMQSLQSYILDDSQLKNQLLPGSLATNNDDDQSASARILMYPPSNNSEIPITQVNSCNSGNSVTNCFDTVSSSSILMNAESIAMNTQKWLSKICEEIDNPDEPIDLNSNYDDTEMIPKDFKVGDVPYEEQIRNTTRYWTSEDLPNEDVMFVTQHWKIINQVMPWFNHFRVQGSNINRTLKMLYEKWKTETEDCSPIDLAEWIRDKVIPIYTQTSIAYFKRLPGFSKFDVGDQAILVRYGQSCSRILTAAIDSYDPDEHKFHNFLVWRETDDTKRDRFMERLISFTEKLLSFKMDSIECSLLNVLVVIATDYPGLQNPSIIENTRKMILATFRAYHTATYGSPNKRMEKCFHLIPELRRLGFIHYAMTTMPTLGLTNQQTEQTSEG